MNTGKLLKRNIIYYRYTHVWVILGVMISTAILVGALLIGDSVRYSLKRIVSNRLGNTEYAIVSRENLMRCSIADEHTLQRENVR